ncbi:S-layer homology domain-containing protein [Crassaminicella thermophila]|nr:S-layer homology domain-containing protein [Crassaminicella thermophila]
MRKLVKNMIITVSVVGCMTFSVFADIKFSDIDNHWARKFITDLTNRNIIAGYPDGTFKPDNDITVLEFTALALKGKNISIPKTDIWYQGILDAAMTEGIILEGEFKTDEYNEPIERGEMARIVVRALKENKLVWDTQFSDDSNIPSELKGYIKKANKLGIINGYPDNTFRDGNATRAEASTMISQMLNIMENKENKTVEEDKTESSEQKTIEEQEKQEEKVEEKGRFIEPEFEIRYEETGYGSNYFSIYIANKEAYKASRDVYKARFVCTNYNELNTIWGRDFYGDGHWIKQDRTYWKDVSKYAFWALRKVHRTEPNDNSEFNIKEGMNIDLKITIKNETTGEQKDYYETVVVKKVDWQY